MGHVTVQAAVPRTSASRAPATAVAVLEAPYTEAVDHHCPLLTEMHELERTLLRTIVVVVVVALLTTRDGNM